jgi:hypothetical protein
MISLGGRWPSDLALSRYGWLYGTATIISSTPPTANPVITGRVRRDRHSHTVITPAIASVAIRNSA